MDLELIDTYQIWVFLESQLPFEKQKGLWGILGREWVPEIIKKTPRNQY